jgi:hypothetical protein
MFVKNVVDIAVDTINVSITHDGSSVYAGNVKSVPFYFLNQKAESINVSGDNLVIEI